MKTDKQLEAEQLSASWYKLRPILGHGNLYQFFILLGAREVGKSYSVTNFFVDQFVNKGIPFTWIRLTNKQASKLLTNNAEKLVDQDIRRKYNLDLITRASNVYAVKRRHYIDKNGKEKSEIIEKTLMARVMDLSTFYSDKGSLFDKDFLNDLTMRYNVAIDEFQREVSEKNTFDIAYALVNQLENILRSTTTRTRIFFLGNSLAESSDILSLFQFIPEDFGTYKLIKNKKKLVQYIKEKEAAKGKPHLERQVDNKYKDVDFGKRAVIHYIPNTDTYNARRKHSIANILMPNASTFTNKVDVDNTLITKKRLVNPSYIIKFTKNQKDWFTVWDSNIITHYNGEKKPVVAMRPYLDEPFNMETQKNIITLFDTRSFMFRNLITFKQFQAALELLKPRK
jgi:hypothetical protein